MTHVGDHYRRVVERYLSTDRGRTAESATTRRLRGLDPCSVGFELRHGDAAAHALRVALDVLGEESEGSGLRPLAECPELIAALSRVGRA
jgi:hypothetical protein